MKGRNKKRRRRLRCNTMAKLSKELQSMMPKAPLWFLRSFVRQVLKRQKKSDIGNSTEMAALMSEIVNALKKKNRLPKQIKKVKAKPVSAKTIKIISVSPTLAAKSFRHNASQEKFNSMQKYWLENGGERRVIRKYNGSQPMIPTQNDLTNEMGDTEADDIGFAPTQQ
jgi:hypothetical protein